MFSGLDAASGLRLIEGALREAAEAAVDSFLEMAAGARAVAAAEVVACIFDRSARDAPPSEPALRWAALVSPAAGVPLVGLARRAVTRVTESGSELAELWSEGETSKWLASIGNLMSRLQ
jgi:hypothetical protein